MVMNNFIVEVWWKIMHNHKEGWNFFAVKQLDLSVKVRTPFKNKEGFDLYFACRIKISGFMFVCLVIV